MASFVILPPRFLGFPEPDVADMSEVPVWMLIRSRLPKMAEMVQDIRIPLRFFKKGICDRRTENVFSEKEEKAEEKGKKKEARVVQDARIPYRFFRRLHTPKDILEACSGETQNNKREASFKKSDFVLQDVKKKSVNMEKDISTKKLLKQIHDWGRVDRGVLRTM